MRGIAMTGLFAGLWLGGLAWGGTIGTVTPWSLCDAGVNDAEVAESLRHVKERTGISKFVLYGPGHSVRQEGLLDVAGYRELGRRVRNVKEAVAADGIEVGYLMLPTMNAGVNHPWQSTVRPEGTVRPFTPCPGETGFREAFAAKCAALAAECRPFLYMMEDDFRFFFGGCFCTNHLKRFAALTGVSRTREELVKALREPSAEALRARWHRLQQDDVLAVARAASAAIAKVSPETRIGLSAPGFVPETDIAELARTLAGRHRPYVRWWGARYGNDEPLNTPSYLFAAQWSAENVGEGMENVYESDIYPHNGYYASAARMTAFMSQMMACGLDGVYHWVPRQTQWGEFPDYLGEYRASAPRLWAIRDEAKKGRSVGLCAAYDPCCRIRHELRAFAPGRIESSHAVAMAFGRLGFPLTTHAAPVTAYATHYAFDGKSDADIEKILSGNVFLDGAAAEVLTERGFASLIGVEATARDCVDFTGEAVAGGRADDTVPSRFHANAGLDGCAVSRLKSVGAEESAFYFSGTRERRVQPSLTRFANARGGRVVTMAVNLAGCTAQNVFHGRKRALLDDAMVWLGGDEALPIRTVGLPNVTVTANANAERLLVHALNLNSDPVDVFRFRVSPSWAGAGVEVLCGSEWRPAGDAAVWTGGELTVRTEGTPLFRTLVCRLVRQTGRDAAFVRAEKTFLAAFDGSRQEYVELMPASFRAEAGALVALHGHGSDRRQFVDDKRGECAAAREAAMSRGLLYVSPDYRAKTSWMGPAAESDMLDLLETLRRERGVSKFFFCGGSMGGTSALTFAARHPDLVAGVVALNPLADHLSYGNFQDAIAASFGGDKKTAYDEYFRRSAINYPERFTMPVSITVGGADTSVPPESARELAKKIAFRRPDLIYFDEVATRRHETDYAASKRAFDEMFTRAERLPPRFRDNTIRLAAVNSSGPDRAAADFLCTGEHDERVFNKAVSLLPLGGRIVLSDGDYYFDACDQEGGSAVFLDYNEGRARVITFAGVTDSKAYNTRYGAGIHVTEKAMRAMSTNGVYRVFYGSPKRPPRGDFGPYPGDFFTYTHVNNLRLENLQILFANATKPLRGVDGSNFGSLYMKKVYIYQESYFRDRFMHIGRPDIPIAGTVGVWSVPSSNDEAAEIRYDHVQVGGLHTGFVFDGVDHLVMEVCAACRCVQGYDFRVGAKTLTLVNCCDEGCTYLPVFRGKKGHVTMIDFNIERFNERFIPVDPEGDRGEHRATEEFPGSWHGEINYTLQGGAFGFAGHGEQRANPFWAPGHGGNWQTTDQNADR